MKIIKGRNTTETLGTAATIGSYINGTSSSRIQMVAGHLSQALPLASTDLPRSLTGLEKQMAEYTFDITMPVNAIVKRVLKRYNSGVGLGSVASNPRTTIFYQNNETGEYDFIDVTAEHSKHRVYGTVFKINPMVGRLREGSRIPAGTILASNPSIKESGMYGMGLETNVAYMAIPSVIEDGIGISESYRRKASPFEMLSFVGTWGVNSYPLNTYGDADNFKPFPDIGDVIRDDGLIYATRTYDEDFDALDMSPKSLMDIDMIFDQRIYGTPGSTVYDVSVESGIGESRAKRVTPEGLSEQCERYIFSTHTYYDAIVKLYNELAREHTGFRVSPAFQRLVTRALADRPNENDKKKPGGSGGKIRRTYKKVPLDEYRVEVKTSKRMLIGSGAKFTDKAGHKGVVCKFIPDHKMPVDAAGNRADVVVFGQGAVARLNTGQMYEHYVNACSRDVSIAVRSMDSSRAWNYLLSYYEIVAPSMYQEIIGNYNRKDLQDLHVASVVDSGVYLYIPAAEGNIDKDIISRLSNIIKPTYGPVTYIDDDNKVIVTKDRVLIGIKDMIILEKTDQHPMATSSGTLQHHGLLSGSSKHSRLSHPSKQQTVRAFGETEVRLFSAVIGADFVAEVLDTANNPDSHRVIIKSIMEAENPTRIEQVIDRKRLPVGNSRTLAFINHILLAMGLKIKG